MPDIRLSFQRYGVSSQEFFRIDWFDDKPLVWAALLANTPKKVPLVNADLVLACTPPGHRIYFAAMNERQNWRLKSLLDANHDFYVEKDDSKNEFSEALPSKRSLPDLISPKRQSAGESWAFIYASTRSPDIIRNVFEHYQFEYGSVAIFPFLISENEPTDWISRFEGFFGPVERRKFTSSMIEESYCLMATYWEHGMELLSNKMKRDQVENIARDIANKYHLDLVIKEDMEKPLDRSSHL
jgi:hypothetical protein